MAQSELSKPLALSELNQVEQKSLLDDLFEPSPALHQLILPIPNTNGQTKHEMIGIVKTRLEALYESQHETGLKTLDEILRAHPRLGEKKTTTLSKSSTGEQEKLRDGATAETELQELNLEYERAFPGLKFLTFVNGRTRPEILEEGRTRITRRDRNAERLKGIKAMCDIATDRLNKMAT